MAEETPLEAGKKPSLLDNLLGAPAKALNQVLNQTTGFYPTVMRVANAESIGDVAEAVGLPAYEEGPEKRNIEKAPKTIEFDANGLFNELVNEAGMSREGAAQDVKQALLGVMAEEKAFLNLTDEDLEQLSNDYGPEELLLMFTDTRDRSSMEAFGEGAAREAVLSPVSLKPGVMVGIKAFKATPGPLPVKLLSGIGAGLVTAATVRGLTEAAMDKALENTRFANDPFLPEDTSMFEAGRAVSEVATDRQQPAPQPAPQVDDRYQGLMEQIAALRSQIDALQAPTEQAPVGAEAPVMAPTPAVVEAPTPAPAVMSEPFQAPPEIENRMVGEPEPIPYIDPYKQGDNYVTDDAIYNPTGGRNVFEE
jgi:hypothetical protein